MFSLALIRRGLENWTFSAYVKNGFPLILLTIPLRDGHLTRNTFITLIFFLWPPCRSSRPKVSCKKVILRNFSKLRGKHLCQSLFFSKVVNLRSATLLKKRLSHRCFLVDFVKFLRTAFFVEHLWSLPLSLSSKIRRPQFLVLKWAFLKF